MSNDTPPRWDESRWDRADWVAVNERLLAIDSELQSLDRQWEALLALATRGPIEAWTDERKREMELVNAQMSRLTAEANTLRHATKVVELEGASGGAAATGTGELTVIKHATATPEALAVTTKFPQVSEFAWSELDRRLMRSMSWSSWLLGMIAVVFGLFTAFAVLNEVFGWVG